MQEEQVLSKKHKDLQAKQLERLHQAAEAAGVDLGSGWTAEVKVRQQGSTAGIALCRQCFQLALPHPQAGEPKTADPAADAWVHKKPLLHAILACGHASCMDGS